MRKIMAVLVAGGAVALLAACGPSGTVTGKFHEDAYEETQEECSVDPDGKDAGEWECEDVQVSVDECFGLKIKTEEGETTQVCLSTAEEQDSYKVGDHYPKEDGS
jgi:hypothetical protein